MSELTNLSDRPRVEALFETLLKICAGEYHLQLPMSQHRDDLDAISHAVNVIVGELRIAKDGALKANQNKSRFLTNVSHELRSPIAIILGYLSLVMAHKSNTESVGYLRKIESNSKHLLALVDQLLSLAQIESGKLGVQNHLIGPVRLKRS